MESVQDVFCLYLLVSMSVGDGKSHAKYTFNGEVSLYQHQKKSKKVKVVFNAKESLGLNDLH